jgi:cysteinyl-tRNA synthetase
MRLLKMKIPDYLPRASRSVEEAAGITAKLVDLGIAYWYRGNVYFDPLKFPGFGKLYGLDMTRWPRKKRRFHKDTYPGIQWNLGDFILWHGYKRGERTWWDTKIGKGRPAWNIQDPAMIRPHFHETLSVYCGGIDNLYRHHDYTLAILESLEPYPMAKYWLHCHHLFVNGHKMSKSKGNVYYSDTLLKQGYTAREVRFFLIYGHYRTGLNYSDKEMRREAARLKALRGTVNQIRKKAGTKPDPHSKTAGEIRKVFSRKMDDDLNVKGAFDGVSDILSAIDATVLKSQEAAGIMGAIREIDGVLKVIF